MQGQLWVRISWHFYKCGVSRSWDSGPKLVRFPYALLPYSRLRSEKKQRSWARNCCDSHTLPALSESECILDGHIHGPPLQSSNWPLLQSVLHLECSPAPRCVAWLRWRRDPCIIWCVKRVVIVVLLFLIGCPVGPWLCRGAI